MARFGAVQGDTWNCLQPVPEGGDQIRSSFVERLIRCRQSLPPRCARAENCQKIDDRGRTGDTLVDLCDIWPAGVMDDDLHAPLASDHPVLLLSGELDPVTPPAWAEEARTGLSNSRHVVAPGQGHGAAIRGCLPRLLADFVDAESFDDVDFGCVERLRAPPFLLSFSGPAP